mgnify:CR=1 FL=1
MKEEMKIRVSYDDGTMETHEVIEALVKFFGGEIEEIYHQGDTHTDFIIRKISK